MKHDSSDREADAVARAFNELRKFLTEPTTIDRMIMIIHDIREYCEELSSPVLEDAIVNDPPISALLSRQAAGCDQLATVLRQLSERLGEKFRGRPC